MSGRQKRTEERIAPRLLKLNTVTHHYSSKGNSNQADSSLVVLCHVQCRAGDPFSHASLDAQR